MHDLYHMLMRGDGMRWIYVLMLCFLILGCSLLFDKRTEKSVTYLTSNESASDVTQGMDGCFIQNEMQLIKMIIQRYEQGFDTTIFYGYDIEHLETISDYLTHIVPFDIKLRLETIQSQHTNKNQYAITLINMDTHYAQAETYAKETIKDIVDDSMSRLEKSQAIHDYIIDHVQYDKSQLIQKDIKSTVFSAYGALIEKKAVCSGYARAFMMYAKLADIPCLLVSANGIDHAWNMIYDGARWLYVDATWDDIEQEERLDLYVNKTSNEFFSDGRHMLDLKEPESFYRRLGNAYFGK